jgi:16S rRNA (cytosine1402-N4)-methyltransferase
MDYHIPVLTREVIHYMAPTAGETYVDCTFGGGSHTRALLSADPGCRVFALDWDLGALEKNGPALEEEFGDRLTLIWGNFSTLSRHLAKAGVREVAGILADFGTSQYQIHERAGFSFATDTPLDMRMSPAHQQITAEHILKHSPENELAQIFFEYGEERAGRKIARSIVAERGKKPFKTTKDLASLIEKIVPRIGNIHPATRAFQALRIVVNRELDNITGLLSAATLACLKPGGRLVCISFHSLEDRLVKDFFRLHAHELEIVTSKVVTAQDDERAINPSSRSAKLRAAMKR